MECYFCKGKMKRSKTTYGLNKSGYHLLIDNVPAWMCTRCGEAYFDGVEVDAIQNAIKRIDTEVSKIREAATA